MRETITKTFDVKFHSGRGKVAKVEQVYLGGQNIVYDVTFFDGEKKRLTGDEYHGMKPVEQ